MVALRFQLLHFGVDSISIFAMNLSGFFLFLTYLCFHSFHSCLALKPEITGLLSFWIVFPPIISNHNQL